jgi:two-component system, cell cycle response regulator
LERTELFKIMEFSGDSILIIDDSDSIRQQVKETLQMVNLFDEYHEASNGIEGFKKLLQHPMDLIVCDIVMPGIDGFKFLTMKNTKPEFGDIPVIMLTSQEDVRSKIMGLEQGASDYITKPFDPSELIARVKVQLKIKKLQDDLRKTNIRLEELSNTDGLTKIFNRRHFMSLFESEFDRAVRYGGTLSYVMCDIDNFKSFNDRYGHLIGDKILVGIGKIFKDSLRKHDLVARYGGEEFALILPETDDAGSFSVSERYRAVIESTQFGTPELPLRVTASFGITSFPKFKPSSIDEMIKQADEALYKAKEWGRNKTVLYAPGLWNK